MQKRLHFMVAAVGVSLLFGGAAVADVLPGQAHVNPDSLMVGTDYVAGGVPGNYGLQVDTMTTNLTRDYVGTVTSTVWRDLTSGYLAFEYSFEIVSGASPVRSATIGGNWLGATVFSVGSDGSGVSTGDWVDGDPLMLGRLGTNDAGAPSIAFSKLSAPDGVEIFAGQRSARFWYATDVTDYITESFDVLDAGDSGDAPVFVVIPEPATLVLLALGGLALIRRQ